VNEILSIMKPIATTIWGIRAGQTGEADTLFLTKSVVALGLAAIGSLDIGQADFTSIKIKIRKLYPTKTPTAVARNASQLFHFFHDISIGDLMIYPSRIDRQVHIGRIDGSYYFDSSIHRGFPHRRSVTWLVMTPRTTFSQGARYEMGSATSLFQIKRHSDEFRDAIRKRITKISR
jgi:restriction system protein